jgi:protein archease
MHEFFDHTADLGIRIRAATLDKVFADAGRALTAAIVEDPTTIRPVIKESISINGSDRIDLMFDWLRDLLIRFETRQMIFAEFDVKVAENGLQATVIGEPVDRARHLLSHEVKAITYHCLIVERDGDGWLAEVIVDI